MTKNENYWQMGADGKPLPYVDGATYRVIIEATTQFNEMRAGTADFMTNVPGRNVAAAKQIATARYIESPYGGNKHQFFFNAIKPPFKDNLKLRQAIQYAMDRDAIAKALGHGLGIPLPYEFVPGAIGYDTTVPFYEFDLDKAKALIKIRRDDCRSRAADGAQPRTGLAAGATHPGDARQDRREDQSRHRRARRVGRQGPHQ